MLLVVIGLADNLPTKKIWDFCSGVKQLQSLDASLLRPKTFYTGSPAPPSRCQPDPPAASRRCGRTRIRRPIRKTTDGSRFQPKSQNSIHSSRCAKFDDMTSRRKTCPRRRPISKMDCKNGESSTFPTHSPRSRGRCTLCATACRRFCTLRNE